MTSSLGRRRRTRTLSEDERRLWEKIAETIEPLDHGHRRGRRAAADPGPDPEPATPLDAGVAIPPSPAPPAASVPRGKPTVVRPTGPTRRGETAGRLPVIHVKHAERSDGLAPAVTAPPSLARLDHRTKRRLVRGVIAIDERLDLHGATQEAAHSILRGFLTTARARGARIVLVITGKGKGKGGADPHDRGVLRRAVPHWLSEPSLREVVLGFEEAHLAHGGAGAIYVRLRRVRGAGEGGR
ncbi:Smr/MutS family protein [Pinisolibacter aquiterrae]|uniref:Smr/MutS family protein n=1 Tax=Pinisolibacter aquiterrae TaxID=2815579 RepID=UPI001C3D9C86|nr:Smr/MutS family protein [Pinisolibacter aquiterrae]MBV5266153.1 Smr/MutS family protein [Pinisolibacter aquiterrae]MCC8236241.1 Smr/MutS family protein [Pinisolibacter aquiterrae]